MAMPYLVKRGGVYNFRRRVPDDVQPHVGQTAWFKSLRTSNRKEAERLIIPDIARTNQIIEDVRAGRFRRFTDEELTEFAYSWLAELISPIGNAPIGEIPTLTDEQAESGIRGYLMLRGVEIQRGTPDYDRLVEIALTKLPKVLFTKARPNVKRQGDELSLSQLLAGYTDQAEAAERTLMDWNTAVSRFIAMFGDKSVLDITNADAREFRDALRKFPRQAPDKIKKGSVKDAVAWADKHKAERLSAATINKALGAIRAILAWAARETDLLNGHPEWNNPFSGINVKEKNNKPRLSYSIGDMSAIFGSTVWTGCKSELRRGEPGDVVIRDEKFWLPLLGLWTGARLEELAQLHTGDLHEQDGIHYLNITDEGEGQKLKTPSSRRRVPLHPELVRVGFLDYAKRLPANGLLFPELEAYRGRFSYQFSKWWGRYIRGSVGLTDTRKAFHSFRHSWKDASREFELDTKVADALQGHTDRSISARYGQGFSLKRLNEEMEKITYPGLQFHHLKPRK